MIHNFLTHPARPAKATRVAWLLLLACSLASASPAVSADAQTNNTPPRWPSLAEVRKTWGQVPLDQVKQAANDGGLTAQHYLGYCFASGERVTKDATNALAWYQRAGAAGYLPSFNNLGLLYQRGDLLPREPTKAFDCYRRAAEGNVPGGQLNLGYAYNTGMGVARDPAKALQWFRKAAENGEANAMCELYVSSEGGFGGVRKPDEAYQWLNRAVAASNAYAQCLLGYRYAYPDPDDHSLRPDFREGVRLLRLSAAQNWPGGLYQLGLCTLRGLGVEQSDERGLELMRQAADYGNGYAMTKLAELYARGIGEPRSAQDRPLQLLLRADANSQLSEKDRRLVRDAIIFRYQCGLGTDRDLIAAAEWYCRSALIDRSKRLPQPNTPSSINRTVANPFQSALSLFLRALRSDDPTAFLEIANSYETGREVPNDPVLAWCWLKLGAQKGASDAMARLPKLEAGMSSDQLQAARTRLNGLTTELAEIARVAK